MIQIPDDPIVRCMERTGYPPWFFPYEDDEDDDDDFFDYGEGTYYGNDTVDF